MRRVLLPLMLMLAGLSQDLGASPRRSTEAAPAPPQKVIEEAGAAYEAGRWEEAKSLYENLLADEGAGASLCYNLGNCWFKLGRRGMAVLWYERARRLAPRDPDVRFNLKVARQGLDSEDFSPWDTLDLLLSRTELSWVVVIFAWLFFIPAGAVALRWIDWRRLKWFLFTAGVLLAVFGAWLAARQCYVRASWAVVVEDQVDVRSGPGEQFTVGFVVKGGRRVLVLERRLSWVEIAVHGEGMKGWTPAGGVSLIESD